MEEYPLGDEEELDAGREEAPIIKKGITIDDETTVVTNSRMIKEMKMRNAGSSEVKNCFLS